jgi:hypothetical protein
MPTSTLLPIVISSTEWWVKPIAMLQHNWALVDSTDTGVVVFFLHDGGTTLTFNKRKHGFDDEGIVVDSLTFATMTDALDGLRRNGFTLETEFDHNLTNYRPSRPFFDGRSVEQGVYSKLGYWVR